MPQNPYVRNLDALRLVKARDLRSNPSVAEKVAWELLRKERTGFKFRRQHGFGPYVLDFYCAEARLALEFDGEQHDPNRDETRDRWFAERGIATFRIPNREFFLIDEPSQDWMQELSNICEERCGRKAWE